jgi:hypothetical protein
MTEAWLAKNRLAFMGLWVALDNGVLLASSKNPREAAARAWEMGSASPTLLKVRPVETVPFAGW